MRKSRKAAGNRKAALRSKNHGSVVRHFGSVPVDRLYLEERDFGLTGKMKIYTDFSWEKVEDYQRFLDEETGILHVTFQAQGHPVKILAFASASEELIYYEITADTTCLNLTVSFEPEEPEAYRNYNLGGFYFEEKKSGRLLIGKGELKCDGFPKADESGIHIKNASRAAFRIFLKSERRKKGISPSSQAMEMQMDMNRYLAKMDDISREALIGRQTHV